MSIEETNPFVELYEINVSSNVDKKGNFSYLSWPFAVAELCKRHPSATWEVMRFPLPDNNAVMVPYMHTPLGYFVEVVVTVDGVARGQVHPVLNHQNKPIAAPTTFDINTAAQRCLVKAIGLHGLGLYIYAGEDLPEGARPTERPVVTVAKAIRDKVVEKSLEALQAGDEHGLKEIWAEFDNDEKAMLWGDFASHERAAMKKLMKD